VTSTPIVAPIVEGHGEVRAVRELVTRIGVEFLGEWIEVAQPFRLDAGKMRQPNELAKAIRVQAARVKGRGGILVLRDGDDRGVTCPVELAASLRPEPGLVSVAVEIVIACPECEAWFLAAADSLHEHPAVRDGARPPADPEGKRDAKGELRQMMTEAYNPTLHQAKFSALINLRTAGRNSRSFRRLVHAIRLLAGAGPS
jgi:hypothetical protein